MRNVPKICFTAIIVLLFTTHAMAGELRVTPSAEIKQEYNDNIYFSTNEIKSDYITTVSPGLEVGRKTERLDATFYSRVDGRAYQKNDELNAIDQTYRGSIRYQISPKMSVTARGSYIQDALPTRDLETTGFVQDTARRFRQNYSFLTEYVFTEKTMATLSYDYWKDDWSSKRYVGSESNSVNLGFTHNLSSIMSSTLGRMNFGYNRYITRTTLVENYTGTLGLKHDISEKWSIIIDAGARYTTSEFVTATYQFVPPLNTTLVTTSASNKAWGMMGQVVLSYKGELTNIDFSYTRDVMQAGGLYGGTERNLLAFKFAQRLTYKFSINLSVGYILNQSGEGEYSPYRINRETYYIYPGLRYQFTKDTAIDASYNFQKVRFSETTPTEAHRSLFLIRLTMQHEWIK